MTNAEAQFFRHHGRIRAHVKGRWFVFSDVKGGWSKRKPAYHGPMPDQVPVAANPSRWGLPS